MGWRMLICLPLLLLIGCAKGPDHAQTPVQLEEKTMTVNGVEWHY
jgi:hypothetical protein